MAIRQLYTEQQYEDGFYDPYQGFYEEFFPVAPTVAPAPVYAAPPPPAPAPAPLFQYDPNIGDMVEIAPPPAPVIAAPAPVYAAPPPPAAVTAPAPAPVYTPEPTFALQYPGLTSEQAYEDMGSDNAFLQQVVASAPPVAPVAAPAPAPEPAPFDPTTFDWTQGIQNIGGTIYQPIFKYTGGTGQEGDYGQQGELQEILKYAEGQTGAGQKYEVLSPTAQPVETRQFQEVGNAVDILQEAAADLGPILQFTPLAPIVQAINAVSAIESGNIAQGIATLASVAGITPDIGKAVGNALDLGTLTAAQTAAIGNAALNAGATLVQGGDIEDVAKAVVPAIISPFISQQVDQTLQTAFGPDVSITGNDTIDNALSTGARDLANAAIKAAITGQDIDLTKTLLPAVAGAVSDATDGAISQKEAAVGLSTLDKVLSGNDIGFNDILGIVKAAAPTKTTDAVKQEPSAGYGGADTGDFFDSEEAQAVQDDIQSILARYPEAAPAPQQVEVSAPAPAPTVQDFIDQIAREEEVYAIPQYEPTPAPPPVQQVEVAAPAPAPTIQDFIDQITKEEAVYAPEPVAPEPTPAPPPEQSYEVIAPAPAPAVFDLPEEVLSALSPAPQARPISDLEKALFQEANVMPEQPQEIVTTGAKPEALLPELPAQPELKDVQDYIQSIINAEAALPPDQTVVTTGSLPEQTLYELPEAPVVQDLYQPPGQLEGPSTIETTGTKLPEVPVIPLEDVPEVIAPPVEAPTIPAPTPTAPPAPGTTTPPAVAPAAPTQAPVKTPADIDPMWAFLFSALMTPQQKEEEKYQLAQIFGIEDPFGRIV